MRFRVLTAISFVLVALGARAVHGLDYPLSPEAIRDAYFLGTGDLQKRADFFGAYTRRLPVPQAGPQVGLIELETPFARVVDEISKHSANYHAPDAQEDFAGKPETFRARAQIHFTPTYPTKMAPGTFWNDFHIHLKQAGEIPVLVERGAPIYSAGTTSGYLGAEIIAEYDAASIKAEPATVEVTGPDGADEAVVFDLAQLR